MGEYEKTIPSIGRFLTGHPLFDRIVDLKYGVSVLMLDETFSEAQKLLHILFEKYGQRYIEKHLEVVPYAHSSDELTLAVGNRPLTDISISLNKMRGQYPKTPIIHTALPDMIMNNDPDDILRLLMAWQKNIREAGTVEFYILPRSTFDELERKILSIVDGGIEIRVDQREDRFKSSFKPIRCCSPEAHLKEFHYILENQRLLVREEDQFTDDLISLDMDEVRMRVEDYKKNLRFLRITSSEKLEASQGLDDYWTLTQIRGKNLREVKEHYPDDFENLLAKVARLEIDNKLRVIRDHAVSKVISKRKAPRFVTNLAIRLPTSVSRILFRSRTGKPRSVPLDIFLTIRKAYDTFFEMMIPKIHMTESDYIEKILEMQKKLHDIGVRETVVQHIRALGENPDIALNIGQLPKLVKLAYISFDLRPDIEMIEKDKYIMEMKGCYECAEITADRPICSHIEGMTTGLIGVLFKRKAICKEVECKALGDEVCRFEIKIPN